MIRYNPDDENAGTQTVNDIFPTCSADTLDGERLAQEPLSQCAYFRANVRDWGQKMSRFQGIYQVSGSPSPFDYGPAFIGQSAPRHSGPVSPDFLLCQPRCPRAERPTEYP